MLLVLLCGSPAPSLVLTQFVQRDVHHAADELEVDDGADCRRQRGADIPRLRIFDSITINKYLSELRRNENECLQMKISAPSGAIVFVLLETLQIICRHL